MDPRIAEILDRIDAAPSAAPRVVATDADGTLWTGDAGDTLFQLFAAEDGWSDAARTIVASEARRWLGPGTGGTTSALATRLLEAYFAGAISVDAICSIEARASGGRSHESLEDWCRRAAEVVARSVRAPVRELLHELKRRGFAIHVVTASLGLVVEWTLRAADLPFDRVTGANLFIDDTRVSCDLRGPVPIQDAKSAALRAAGDWPPTLGMGDGGWDAAFLQGSQVALLVHPREALVQAMGGHPNAATWR